MKKTNKESSGEISEADRVEQQGKEETVSKDEKITEFEDYSPRRLKGSPGAIAASAAIRRNLHFS
ncbi:hypothetical protein [Xanthomonas citri]|uniref:hypothetical protein n=1 Tax=Xanthomonas citri TaxID=346 RepID=UPI00103DB9A1|nr:hypothetical protein [Xanthomonas citri]